MSEAARRFDSWSAEDWSDWMRACLELRPHPEGGRPSREAPLLAVEHALELPLDANARTNHLAGAIRLLERLLASARSEVEWNRVGRLLAHLAETATERERNWPERASLEPMLLGLFQRDGLPDGLRRQALGTLAALDLPRDSAFWWKVLREGPDPLMAAEVLGSRMEPGMGEVLKRVRGQVDGLHFGALIEALIGRVGARMVEGWLREGQSDAPRTAVQVVVRSAKSAVLTDAPSSVFPLARDVIGSVNSAAGVTDAPPVPWLAEDRQGIGSVEL